MPTQQNMKRRIDRTRDLQSVVGTMKALAAVSIRQYEKAAESIDAFNETVELGLRIVLRSFGAAAPPPRDGAGGAAAVVVGSDQGMCGRFNEDAAEYALQLFQREGSGETWRVVIVGERVAAPLAASGHSVVHRFDTPGAASGITRLVQGILSVLGNTERLGTVLVVHNRHPSGSSYEPSFARLLPLDRRWIASFRDRPWPTNQLPAFRVERGRLFAFLVRQYLFVAIYRAVAHSLSAENASRLAAMQVAEKNIEERLGELTESYHRLRQSAITGELLDIVSGFEALK